MRIGRFGAVVVGLYLAAEPSQAAIAPGLPAAAQVSGTSEVVVTGLIDRKRGSWKRAESDHVVVIGQDSATELTRVSRNLERLYYLMARLYRHGDTSDDTVKLQVVLFDTPSDLRALNLRNLRSEQGPFLPGFTDPTYYDPRDDGAVLAIGRGEQIVDLNTMRAFNLDCDDFRAGGATDSNPSGTCAKLKTWRAPAVMNWEQMLYARFAQHFILTYDPGVYPRWYLDGIGALFSTVEVKGDGSLDYARPLVPYQQVFRAYGDMNVGDILTGRYLDSAAGKVDWTPYHAWLLAHYFLFSNPKPERAAQFRRYMADVHRGVPMAEAAKVFGNMAMLQREVLGHGQSDIVYAHAKPPPEMGDVLISTLPPASAALIQARVAMGTRLALDEKGAAGATDPASPGGQWLAQVRGVIARQHYDADAFLFAAEAECRSGHPDRCLADAETVLAKAPKDARALAWKGAALTDQALAGPEAERTEKLVNARNAIEQAIALDDQAPAPRIALFESYAKAGERVPEEVMQGMAVVIRRVPAAPAPRLHLGEELVRQGRADIARQLLYTVTHSGYDSPEKKAAERLFASSGGAAIAPPRQASLR
jgi:hypothetical protein